MYNRWKFLLWAGRIGLLAGPAALIIVVGRAWWLSQQPVGSQCGDLAWMLNDSALVPADLLVCTEKLWIGKLSSTFWMSATITAVVVSLAWQCLAALSDDRDLLLERVAEGDSVQEWRKLIKALRQAQAAGSSMRNLGLALGPVIDSLGTFYSLDHSSRQYQAVIGILRGLVANLPSTEPDVSNDVFSKALRRREAQRLIGELEQVLDTEINTCLGNATPEAI